ncbi:hypothetical protein M0R45_006476 [Rubus argutus]|uniref:Uncharacterized protein n=1 Tax=Rubus argutus TaxID=59490 RepID=A0AAW1YQX4_RUBAR
MDFIASLSLCQSHREEPSHHPELTAPSASAIDPRRSLNRHRRLQLPHLSLPPPQITSPRHQSCRSNPIHGLPHQPHLRRRASQPTRDPRLSAPAPIGPAFLKHCHRCNYHCSTRVQ